jgi:hypothetical protein
VVILGKGYKGKGIGEGFRYGVHIGIMFGLPMAIGTYRSFPIAGAIAIGWGLARSSSA